MADAPDLLDAEGRQLPTRPCYRCGAPTPIRRMAVVDVRRNGWRCYRPALNVHWCGHGVEVIAVPDEGGMYDLVPVLGEISVEVAELCLRLQRAGGVRGERLSMAIMSR